jgi:hypothetical protein
MFLLTDLDLEEINRGLLMRLDFLARVRVDCSTKDRKKADAMAVIAREARDRVVAEMIDRKARIKTAAGEMVGPLMYDAGEIDRIQQYFSVNQASSIAS